MRSDSDSDERNEVGSSHSGDGPGEPPKFCGTAVEVERLMRQVDSDMILVGEHIDDLDGASAASLLGAASKLTKQLEALRLRLVSRIEASGIWQVDESTTAASWLRENDILDHRGAKSDLAAASLMCDYPRLGAAADSGAISRAHVDTIANVGLRTPSRREALGDFMEIFINIARTAPPSTLRKVMRAWVDQVDPLTTAKDESEAHGRRYLNVNQLADGIFLEGFFGHEQGAKVLAAVNAALTKSRRASTNSPSPDEESSSTLPQLSTSQQRADAFIGGIIDPLLTSGGLPSTGGARASVTVLVPLERLEQPCSKGVGSIGVGQAGLNIRSESAEDASQNGRLLELGSASIGVNNGPGTALLSAAGAQRMTCDCNIHRIVLSPEGLPLDVGRTMRTFPAHLRKALNLRDGGCVFPNCDKLTRATPRRIT